MILPVVVISVIYFISASLGSEESCYLSEEQEDECAAVCYPIVKPLLRYFEKCQEKEAQASQCQKDYLELKNKLQSKDLEVDSLKAEIDKKNFQIDLLNDKIVDLKKTSELGVLTNQFREDIAKLRETVINGDISKNREKQEKLAEDKVKTLDGQTTKDRCPRSQKENKVVQEIRVPGLDPFKVVCLSNELIGSGWMMVYNNYFGLNKFNRQYDEYVIGFGDAAIENEFFIGLQKLHLLTNDKPHDVKVYSSEGHETCRNFIVGSHSEGYMVKSIDQCDGFSKLGLRQGSKFTTFYQDDAGKPYRNWPEEKLYGWWFNYKNRTNLRADDIILRMYIRRIN